MHLKGIGPSLAERLEKCGIYTVQDLLFHLPSRYQDRTRVTPLNRLRPGDHVVIEAAIVSVEVSRRNHLACHMQDESGHNIVLKFFHFSDRQKQSFREGIRLRCFGEVKGFRGDYEMIHPEYIFINRSTPPVRDDCLTPIYPTTEGLSQRQLRQATDQALELIADEQRLPDYLPATLLQEVHMPGLIAALQYVHRPPPNADVEQLLAGTHPAQQRLAFEELLAHQLSLRRLRNFVQHHQAPALHAKQNLTNALLNSLAFKLTGAQQRVSQEIASDIAQPKPMLRLLQGDVGSGKTIVAAVAALQAVENTYQAVLMAPTELLAEQHHQNFLRWLEPLNIEVAWLAGKLKAKIKQEMLEKIASGTAQVIVGTHALFQADVEFAKLGLIIVDEQHRFGVHQRLALREKGVRNGLHPHQLIMTATPIPRTLAMTAYADLDNSLLDELPPGRIPVTTVVVANHRRDEIIERVRQACKEGKQIYWVCPLITESEQLECQAAETTAQVLADALMGVRIGLVHGRMHANDKEEVMRKFKNAELDLLVATTVIEVGVDVPNASLMIIENAERLGLAQLHQLRGRVGRGSNASFCVLLYQYDRLSALGKERLKIMRETNDGFVIANRDLELRGPGEVLGTRQAGMLELKIAELLRDHGLLPKITQAAEIMLRDYPDVVEPLIERWLATKKRYGEA